MFKERFEVTERVQELAALAGAELLQAYGVTASRVEGWVQTDELLYSGVMGFFSRTLSGTCLLAAPEATVLAAAPPEARPRDWVGELANQLVGRLKAKLLARGVTIAMSTPIVVSGLRVTPLPRGNRVPAVFETATGRVLIWLEVEATEDFHWGEERQLLGNEGDLLVF
jgi:hypothetical protein